MSDWKADEDGRLSCPLGEIHPGTETTLVIGDDGVVRAVTVANRTTTWNASESAPEAESAETGPDSENE